MTSRQAIALYGVLSVAFLMLVRPGFGALSGILALIAGPIGAPRLFVTSASGVYYDTLDSGVQFSSEYLVVSIISIALWILGAVLIYFTVKRQWPSNLRFGTALVWIASSAFNVYFFSIQSV